MLREILWPRVGPGRKSGPHVSSKSASGSSMTEPAKVFEDRIYPGNWRVEWEDDDGGVEVTIFSGPDARDRAFQYAASFLIE
jgi:hypothetical protein